MKGSEMSKRYICGLCEPNKSVKIWQNIGHVKNHLRLKHGITRSLKGSTMTDVLIKEGSIKHFC